MDTAMTVLSLLLWFGFMPAVMTLLKRLLKSKSPGGCANSPEALPTSKESTP